MHNIVDVAVVMGSVNDARVMSKAVDTLKSFRVTYEYLVVSAHRTPDRLYEFANSAHQRFKVIIAGAGGAAHLPGMVASMTILPVIGIPIAIEPMNGVDSVWSILQMPNGVPVGTVKIDGSVNAALLALRILALDRPSLRDAITEYKQQEMMSVPYTPPGT